MKNILSVVFAFLFLSLVLNCFASKLNNTHYQREWMMVSLDQFSKQELVEKKAGINLTGEKTGNQVKGTANMGCNSIFFTAELNNSGKIKISNLGSTEKACLNMDIENAFMQKFSAMKKYKIEGHRLTLSDDKGNQIQFIAADWD